MAIVWNEGGAAIPAAPFFAAEKGFVKRVS